MDYAGGVPAVAGYFIKRMRGRKLPPGLWRALLVEGWTSLPELRLLFDLAKDVRDGCIIEVGSYRGRSTVALALGATHGANAPVFAVEPHEEFVGVMGTRFGPEDRLAFYATMRRSGCWRNVRLLNTSSEIVAKGWNRRVGLLWIDGDHSYAGVARDFAAWEPHLAPGAPIAFDDATDPALGPTRLVRELTDSGRYTRLSAVGKIVVLAATSRAG